MIGKHRRERSVPRRRELLTRVKSFGRAAVIMPCWRDYLPRHRRMSKRLHALVVASLFTALMVVPTGKEVSTALDTVVPVLMEREPLLSRANDPRPEVVIVREAVRDPGVQAPTPSPGPVAVVETPAPAPVPIEEPEPVPEPEPEPVVSDGLSFDRDAVIAFARAQIGDPYVYGSEGPDSWDCSGLTQAAFASVGLSLPRVSDAQAGVGYSTLVGNLEPGDLVAWSGHVALYTGSGMIVEAARPGTTVRERPLTDNGWDNDGWGVKLDYSTL